MACGEHSRKAQERGKRCRMPTAAVTMAVAPGAGGQLAFPAAPAVLRAKRPLALARGGGAEAGSHVPRQWLG